MPGKLKVAAVEKVTWEHPVNAVLLAIKGVTWQAISSLVHVYRVIVMDTRIYVTQRQEDAWLVSIVQNDGVLVKSHNSM